MAKRKVVRKKKTTRKQPVKNTKVVRKTKASRITARAKHAARRVPAKNTPANENAHITKVRLPGTVKKQSTLDVLSKPNISLFILAYNEEENIPLTIELATEFLSARANKWEIILIDDHSSDRTLEVARSLKRRYQNIRIIHHHTNRGYGRVQRNGYKHARFDLVTYLPGDNQLRSDALHAMLDEMQRTNVDIVIGARHKRQDHWHRAFFSGLYNLGLKILFGLRLRDIDSIKIIKRGVFDSLRLTSRSAIVDLELLVKANRLGFKIREIPVPSYPRTYGTPTGNSLRVVTKQLKELFGFWFKVHI